MTQSTQGHTLIINIQLDDSAEDIYYKIDRLTLASGQIPGNGDPAAQVHFNCLDCQTRYFILPQIIKLVELDEVSKLKVSKVKTVDVKNASEPYWLESGSSDEVLTDDEVLEVEKEVPVAIGNNKEKQDSKVVVKNEGQNNRHRPKKEISEVEKKYYYQSYYTCDICKSSIKHRKHLTPHMSIHLGIRYSCSECTKSFSQKSDLVRHKKRIHKIEFRNGELCKWRETCTKGKNLLHFRRQRVKFRNNQRQKTEISKLKMKHYYTCDICKTSIKYRDSLIRHMKIHMGMHFSCSECSKSFSRKCHLVRHKKRFHQSEFRTCELCKWSKTCTKAEFYSHLRRRHPKFHINVYCQKVHNFNSVDFLCIYCETQAIFNNFEKLKEHLRVIHDRKFPCSSCLKAWSKQSVLNRHIESVHEKMTFSCPKSEKVLAWQSGLKRHLRSHNT